MATACVIPIKRAAPLPRTEVSRHTTSEGTVLWSRCATCGRLRMELLSHSGERTVAGGATPGCPDC